MIPLTRNRDAQAMCHNQQMLSIKSSGFLLASVSPRRPKRSLEVAMKSNGSQGNRRPERVYPEPLLTATSAVSEVYAKPNEAQNSALRRRWSAERRRQHRYARCVQG